MAVVQNQKVTVLFQCFVQFVIMAIISVIRGYIHINKYIVQSCSSQIKALFFQVIGTMAIAAYILPYLQLLFLLSITKEVVNFEI